MYNNINKPTFW